MIINLVIGSVAAYTFSRLQFRGKTSTFNFFLGSRLIPVIAVAIPYYVIIQTMGLLDTHISLILVYLALTIPFSIWFLTLYFNGIPQDFEDAALIDGCSRFQALVRIVIPMSLPGFVAAAAFSFMTSYNEFLFALFNPVHRKSDRTGYYRRHCWKSGCQLFIDIRCDDPGIDPTTDPGAYAPQMAN